jgi:hypothetical protein
MGVQGAGITIVLAGLAMAATPAAAGTRAGGRQDPATRALAFFQADSADNGFQIVRRLRPAPLSAQARALVVAALPREGELSPTAAEEAKIAALAPVFDLHERKGLVVVKVIDVGHAFVGLHAKTVLLLSRDALSLLAGDELQALAAHELGHESFWNEYAEARAAGDDARLQELELVCDGVAVATLRRLGRGPENLVDAVTKMTRYNERLHATGTAGRYVSLKERRRYIQDVAAILEGRGQALLSRFEP